MLSSNLLPFIAILITTGYSWNVLQSLPKMSIGNFTQRISSLRQYLDKSKSPRINISSSSTTTTEHYDKVATETLEDLKRENVLDKIFSNKEELFLKMSEMGDKIVEIKEKVEPKVKRFLTEQYNSFLSNLIPYSETIGVPTYVLNSLKIPQNFDPRLQLLVQSMMKDSIPLKKLLESLPQVSKDKRSSGVEGRSEDPDFLSDQEPDATSKGHKKYQHFYVSSRNRPKTFIDRNNGYEVNFDGGSAFEEDNENGELFTKGYYTEDVPHESSSDLYPAAGTTVARGHSRGDYGGHGGGGGGGGGNGLTDPFTILGGLAFLTYLAMLVQQSMRPAPAPAPAPAPGRRSVNPEMELDITNISKAVPIILAKLRQRASEEQKKAVQMPKSSFHKVKNEDGAISFPCTDLCQLMRRFKNLKQTSSSFS